MTIPTKHPLTGLELVTPRGQRFVWAEHRVTPNGLRLDTFVSKCKQCGAPFRVPVRLLRDLALKYTRRAELARPGEAVSVRIELTREQQRAMHNTALIRCPNHRKGAALV